MTALEKWPRAGEEVSFRRSDLVIIGRGPARWASPGPPAPLPPEGSPGGPLPSESCPGSETRGWGPSLRLATGSSSLTQFPVSATPVSLSCGVASWCVCHTLSTAPILRRRVPLIKNSITIPTKNCRKRKIVRRYIKTWPVMSSPWGGEIIVLFILVI